MTVVSRVIQYMHNLDGDINMSNKIEQLGKFIQNHGFKFSFDGQNFLIEIPFVDSDNTKGIEIEKVAPTLKKVKVALGY